MEIGIPLPLFPPESSWQPPSMSDLPEWPEHGRVCIDTETRDPLLTKLGPGVRRAGSYVCGVPLAIEDGPAHYLPLRHGLGENLDEDGVWRYLRDQAARFRGTLVGCNLAYDLDWLAENGVEFPHAQFRDVMLMDALCDERHKRYGLEAIARRRGLPGKSEAGLEAAARAYGWVPRKKLAGRTWKLKEFLWYLPASAVAEYAIQDVRLPLHLLRRQERDVADQELENVVDLEHRLLPVVVRMRRRGIRVDFDQLDRVSEWSVREEKKALDRIHQDTGVRLNSVMAAAECEKVLKAIGVTCPLTQKTRQPSVTKEFLDSIDHPVAGLIRRARKVNKVRTTFVASMLEHQVNGRVHTTFRQLKGESSKKQGETQGAGPGRTSSVDPNLQQQPARDKEIGPMWRAVFLPDEGCELSAIDYSQQEPRMAVHFAEELNAARPGLCRRAHVAGDRYRNDPATDFHDMMTSLIYSMEKPNPTNEDWEYKRKVAKNQFLGILYGMGGAKLCHQIGLPTKWIQSRNGHGMIEVAGDEGAAMIRTFHRMVPWARELADTIQSKAEKEGFIRTLSGRRVRFPKLGDGSYDWTHKALNNLIQGSSADQTKLAMVLAEESGIALQLTVHDELVHSIADRREAGRLAEVMTNCYTLRVPSKVDVEIGPNWGQVEKWELKAA